RWTKGTMSLSKPLSTRGTRPPQSANCEFHVVAYATSAIVRVETTAHYHKLLVGGEAQIVSADYADYTD
ncbi:MAG: hypothetical protein M3539_12310, partial [Acidobacteriota bacterium]|nr:hypothetical protein [Acidobacteriota bacterium]